MTELVVHHPFSVNGNSYQRGDIVAKADEQSVLEHPMLYAKVTRRAAQT